MTGSRSSSETSLLALFQIRSQLDLAGISWSGGNGRPISIADSATPETQALFFATGLLATAEAEIRKSHHLNDEPALRSALALARLRLLPAALRMRVLLARRQVLAEEAKLLLADVEMRLKRLALLRDALRHAATALSKIFSFSDHRNSREVDSGTMDLPDPGHRYNIPSAAPLEFFLIENLRGALDATGIVVEFLNKAIFMLEAQAVFLKEISGVTGPRHLTPAEAVENIDRLLSRLAATSKVKDGSQ